MFQVIQPHLENDSKSTHLVLQTLFFNFWLKRHNYYLLQKDNNKSQPHIHIFSSGYQKHIFLPQHNNICFPFPKEPLELIALHGLFTQQCMHGYTRNIEWPWHNHWDAQGQTPRSSKVSQCHVDITRVKTCSTMAPYTYVFLVEFL